MTAAQRRKSQVPKPQNPKVRLWKLRFGVCLGFGVWDLKFSVTSVTEMPDAGENHRHFAFVGDSNDFLVAD
jgi:hypothetical protein